jgi:hypothetical protein
MLSKLDDYIVLWRYIHTHTYIYKGQPPKTLGQGGCADAGEAPLMGCAKPHIGGGAQEPIIQH